MKESVKSRALWLASVSPAALALVGGANAADLPIKAPQLVAVPAPTISWTGCYVGAHAGYGWGHQDPNATTAHTFSFSSGSTTTNFAGSNGFESSGGLAGGQVGCNYQFATNWVAGVEGNISAADIHGTGNDPLNASLGTNGSISVNTDWLASVVGRLGITAWNNQALFYVKAGAAWDHNKWNLSNASVPGPSFSETRSGWTVGGGVEWAFTPKWSAFADFSHFDFGNGTSITYTGPSDVVTFSTGKQHIEAVKLGVNYKFTGP